MLTSIEKKKKTFFSFDWCWAKLWVCHFNTKLIDQRRCQPPLTRSNLPRWKEIEWCNYPSSSRYQKRKRNLCNPQLSLPPLTTSATPSPSKSVHLGINAASTKCTTSSLWLPRWQRTERKSQKHLDLCCTTRNSSTQTKAPFRHFGIHAQSDTWVTPGALFCVRFSLTILSPFCGIKTERGREAGKKGGRNAAALR